MNYEFPQGTRAVEKTAKIVYILYLLSIFIGITGIIGVIMAYIYKSDAPSWLTTHFQFQIRTFWIGLFYLLISGLLSFVIIGYLIILFWVIWMIVRCVKGIKFLDQKQPYPDPKVWLF